MPAPRITEQQIIGKILTEQYHVFPGTTLTVCSLTLKNGYQVTGESACVSPENFNAEKGKKIAYDNAFQKIWMLEGYLLRETLHNTEPVPADSFQDRVRNEKRELDEKLDKLVAFFDTPTFVKLKGIEQDRLARQADAMKEYSFILGDRIAAF